MNHIFYLWLDEQVLQLRFNIIPGEDVSLPFGCTVNKVDSIDPVIKIIFDRTSRAKSRYSGY